MNDAQWTKIRPLIIDSCISLFASAGCYARHTREIVTSVMQAEGMAAFVGITSAQIRGGIGLAMPLPLLLRTHPQAKRGGDPREGELRDWTCELANLFAGRLKNKFLQYGIAFRVSPPMVVLGKDMRPPFDLQAGLHVLEFQYLEHTFHIHFLAEITPGAEMRAEPHRRQVKALPVG